jgi:hypothetical protein
MKYVIPVQDVEKSDIMGAKRVVITGTLDHGKDNLQHCRMRIM